MFEDALGVAKIIPRVRAGAAGIFPLGFSRQSERLVRSLAELLTERHRFAPCNPLDGLATGGGTLKEARVAAHQELKKLLCDFDPAHQEWLCDLDTMSGKLFGANTVFIP